MTEVTPLDSRRAEVAQYQANIDMYKAIASNLPSEWPEHLIQFKGVKDQHATIANLEDLDDVILVSDLWAYESAQAAIRSETVEMRKAMSILTVMEAQA